MDKPILLNGELVGFEFVEMLVRGDKKEITAYYLDKVTEMRNLLKDWLDNLTPESLGILKKFLGSPPTAESIKGSFNGGLRYAPEDRYTDEELKDIYEQIDYFSKQPDIDMEALRDELDYKGVAWSHGLRNNGMSDLRRYELLKGKRYEIIYKIDENIKRYLHLATTTRGGEDILLLLNIFEYIANIRCGDYYIYHLEDELNLYPYLENDGEFSVNGYMYALIHGIILIGVPTTPITKADYIERCPYLFMSHDLSHTMRMGSVLKNMAHVKNAYNLIEINKGLTDTQKEIAIIGLWILVHEFYTYPRNNRNDSYDAFLANEKRYYEIEKEQGEEEDEIIYDMFTGYYTDTRRYRKQLLSAIDAFKGNDKEFRRLFNTSRSTMRNYVLKHANEIHNDFDISDEKKYIRMIIINSRLAKLFVWIALGLIYRPAPK